MSKVKLSLEKQKVLKYIFTFFAERHEFKGKYCNHTNYHISRFLELSMLEPFKSIFKKLILFGSCYFIIYLFNCDGGLIR